MENSPLDDEEEKAAVRCLLDAIVEEIKPGVLELRLAANTLREFLADPNDANFSLATRAFDAINAETRRRISWSATSNAQSYIQKNRGQAGPAEPELSPLRLARMSNAQATGLLQALNRGSPRTPSAPVPTRPQAPTRSK
jgi:hypothetical protein